MKLSKLQVSLALVSILLVGLALRCYKINSHGIWKDEKTSLRAAVGLKDFNQIYNDKVYQSIPTEELKFRDDIIGKQPFTSADYWQYNDLHHVKNAIVLDNSNSLAHAVALHYWVGIFGTSDVAARGMSVFFSLLTLMLAFYFARRYLDNDLYSLGVVALLAVNIWLILNSQLVRTYSFTTFFAFLSTVVFFDIVFRGKGGWRYAVYVFAAVMTLGGHHMALSVFIGHGLIALLFLRDKTIWRNLVFTAIPILVIYGLWMFKFGADGFAMLKWKNMVLADRALKYPDAKFPGAGTPKNIFGGVVNYLNMIMGTHMLAFGLRIFMVLALLVVPFGLSGLVYLKAAGTMSRKIIVSLIIIILVTPLLSVVMSFRSHNAVPFTIFYAAFAVPLGATLLMLSISYIPKLSGGIKKIAIAFAAIQVGLILLSFTQSYKEVMTNAPTPNPYMQIAKDAKQQYQPGDFVVYDSWDDAEMTNLYLKDRPDIQQKVDTTLKDQVYLLKGDQRQLLFDFEGDKYRY